VHEAPQPPPNSNPLRLTLKGVHGALAADVAGKSAGGSSDSGGEPSGMLESGPLETGRPPAGDGMAEGSADGSADASVDGSRELPGDVLWRLPNAEGKLADGLLAQVPQSGVQPVGGETGVNG